MLFLLSAGCTDSDRLPEPVDLPRADSGADTIIEIPEWVGATTEVYAADLDADERLDLVLTSHAMNRVQPYRQLESGRFAPLPPLDGVGFHPNGVVSYGDDQGRLFLLQNAETRGEVRIYRHKRAGMAFHGAITAPSPLLTVPLDDTGLPGSLVVLSRGRSSLTLYHGFDPQAASFAEQITLWRPEQTKVGLLRSPITARLAAGADAELIFIDTLVDALRVLRFTQDGDPFMDDLYLAGPDFQPALVVAAKGVGQAPQPLFLVGGAQAPLRMLSPDPVDGLKSRDLQLPEDFNHDLALIEDADQPPLLVISRRRSLTLVRFPDGLDGPPVWSKVKKDPQFGQVFMAAADFDGDGQTDLALANSGNVSAPPLLLRGPIWEHAAALTEYYSDATRFEPIVRPRTSGTPPLPRPVRIPGVPDVPSMQVPPSDR